MEHLDLAVRVTRRASLAAVLGVVGAVAGGAAVEHTGAEHGAAASAARSPHGGMHLIGDSWAAGLHADPARALGQVAAEALGMHPTIDAISGTGYVNTAGHSNYVQRARVATGSPSLVIVQGGSNDDGHALADIHTAALDTYRALRGRFPRARLIVLGPGPDPEPVDEVQLAVDRTLQGAAEFLGLTYISMFTYGWVPEGRSSLIIDPSTRHPTTAGQEYFGLRLAAAARLTHPSLFTGLPAVVS